MCYLRSMSGRISAITQGSNRVGHDKTGYVRCISSPLQLLGGSCVVVRCVGRPNSVSAACDPNSSVSAALSCRHRLAGRARRLCQVGPGATGPAPRSRASSRPPCPARPSASEHIRDITYGLLPAARSWPPPRGARRPTAPSTARRRPPRRGVHGFYGFAPARAALGNGWDGGLRGTSPPRRSTSSMTRLDRAGGAQDCGRQSGVIRAT
jgi:hypothetical protein